MSSTVPFGPAGQDVHVVGLFGTREQTESALDALLAAGFASDAVSVVTAEGQQVAFPTAAEEQVDTGTRNTAIGAAVGALAGLLILGPLALLGGAIAGGAFGLLTALGASHEQAEYLTERVRSGHYLVVVRAGDREPEADTILANAGASDVHRLRPSEVQRR